MKMILLPISLVIPQIRQVTMDMNYAFSEDRASKKSGRKYLFYVFCAFPTEEICLKQAVVNL